jgi:hypothetical protein
VRTSSCRFTQESLCVFSNLMIAVRPLLAGVIQPFSTASGLSPPTPSNTACTHDELAGAEAVQAETGACRASWRGPRVGQGGPAGGAGCSGWWCWMLRLVVLVLDGVRPAPPLGLGESMETGACRALVTRLGCDVECSQHPPWRLARVTLRARGGMAGQGAALTRRGSGTG